MKMSTFVNLNCFEVYLQNSYFLSKEDLVRCYYDDIFSLLPLYSTTFSKMSAVFNMGLDGSLQCEPK